MEQKIRKIAILHCRKSAQVCTGAACFRAFYDREKFFKPYRGEEVELSAYFDCNGCEANKWTDDGFHEKLERLKQEHVDLIHIGKCCYARCEQLDKIKESMDMMGLSYTEGTH